MYNVGEGFGKGGAFFLLALFLPIVWLLWLAFDKNAVWQGSSNDASGNVPPAAMPPQSPQPPQPPQPPQQTPGQLQ